MAMGKKKHAVSPAGHRLATLARLLISHPLSPVEFAKDFSSTTTTTNMRPDADDDNVDSYREMGPPSPRAKQSKGTDRCRAKAGEAGSAQVFSWYGIKQALRGTVTIVTKEHSIWPDI